MASLALSTRLRNTLTVFCCADSAGGYAVLSPLRQQRLRRCSLERTVDGVVMSWRPQCLKKQPIGRIMRYHCKIRTAVGDCAEAIGTDWSTCSPPRARRWRHWPGAVWVHQIYYRNKSAQLE